MNTYYVANGKFNTVTTEEELFSVQPKRDHHKFEITGTLNGSTDDKRIRVYFGASNWLQFDSQSNLNNLNGLKYYLSIEKTFLAVIIELQVGDNFNEGIPANPYRERQVINYFGDTFSFKITGHAESVGVLSVDKVVGVMSDSPIQL